MFFDSLIYNTDRYLGNFGMLVDNKTRKLLGTAPIFDNGNSILSFLNEKTSIENIFRDYTSKFNIDFDVLLHLSVQERHKEYNLLESLLEKGEKFISERA